MLGGRWEVMKWWWMMGLGDCYGGEGIIARVFLVGIRLWRGGLCNMHCMWARERRGVGLKTFFRVNR